MDAASRCNHYRSMNSNPRIESITAVLVDLPTIRAHKLAMTTLSRQTLVIVSIASSDGITGIGEATTIGGLAYGEQSPEGIKLSIDAYVAPLLVGQEINLPPVVVLLAQIIAGVFFGFLGLLLSVPLAAVATVLVREIYIRDILGDTGEPERASPPTVPPERAGSATLEIAIAPKTTG